MSRTPIPPILLLTLAIMVSLGGFADAAPPPPAHLALTAAPLAGQVGLTWNAAAGATSYSVKRATAVGGPFTALGSPTITSFTDTTAAAGTRYFYRVTAADGTGEGVPSLTISTVPAIVVDNADASGVTLTGAWSASSAVAGFYGTNYLLDGNTGATGGKKVRFTPTLTSAGRYDVFLRGRQMRAGRRTCGWR